MVIIISILTIAILSISMFLISGVIINSAFNRLHINNKTYRLVSMALLFIAMHISVFNFNLLEVIMLIGVILYLIGQALKERDNYDKRTTQ